MSGMNRLRLPRSAAVTAVSMALTAGAHVTGGGTLPAPGIVLALGALLLVPAAALSARRFSLRLLAVLVGSGQILLHQAFTALSTPAACLPHGTRITAHHVHVTSLACPPALPPTGEGLPALTDPPMAAAHALATAATVILLARSEEALWLLTAWLAPLTSLPRPALFPVPGTRSAVRGPVFRPFSRVCLQVHRLRGPPAAAAAPPVS